MTALPFGMILEVLVILLLAATVFYCILLDRRLRALRSGQDGLKQVILELDSATNRAQASVAQLRKVGNGVAEDLAQSIELARGLVDELGLMVESGNNLADRLEAGSRVSARGNNVRNFPSSAEEAEEAEPSEPPERPERSGRDEGLENKIQKALREAR